MGVERVEILRRRSLIGLARSGWIDTQKLKMTADAQQPVIILGPGQGAQAVGMGKSWFDASDVARATFEQADAQLGIALSQTCFEGPAEQVNRTDVAQLAIFVTSMACARALIEDQRIGPIAAAGGLSLGEYTALCMAGSITFEDGLRIVEARGRFMQEAAEASDSGMVAMIGADEEQTKEVCDRAGKGDILVPANLNCPGQVVISGSTAACDRAETVAGEMGLRASRLSVAGAFHSPFMKPAADQLAVELDKIDWRVPQFPVACNITGGAHEDDVTRIKQRLVEHLTGPVRWEQNVRWLLDNAEGQYIELAPGKVLSGLMRRIDRGTKVTNLNDPDRSDTVSTRDRR